MHKHITDYQFYDNSRKLHLKRYFIVIGDHFFKKTISNYIYYATPDRLFKEFKKIMGSFFLIWDLRVDNIFIYQNSVNFLQYGISVISHGEDQLLKFKFACKILGGL